MHWLDKHINAFFITYFSHNLVFWKTKNGLLIYAAVGLLGYTPLCCHNLFTYEYLNIALLLSNNVKINMHQLTNLV